MSVLSNLSFGKIAPGLVRLGVNGQMAIKVGSDYKYYDANKSRLVNCDNFVFDIGTEFFFAMPTNKVKAGDIILVSNKPAYVLEPETRGRIEILSYEDGSIKTILPERHTFLGGTYMYTKIVSMFGNKAFDKNNIMKFMMLNTMFGNGGAGNNLFGGSNSNGMNPMMLMMLMGGNGNPLFDMFGAFDEDGADGLFGNIFNGDTSEEETEKDGE